MDTIVIKINRHQQEEVLWAKVSEQGQTVLNKSSIMDIAEKVGKHRLVALVPGEDVLITKVNIPGSTRFSKQAVPFALEEHLIEDVEKFHFVYGKKYSDDTQFVAVVSMQTMDRWLAFLSEVLLEPDVIIPETLAIPYEKGNISVAVEDCLALVRTGEDHGFAVDIENFESLVIPELQRADSPLVQLHGLSKTQLHDELLRSRAQTVSDGEDLFSIMVENASKRTFLNLREGPFGKNAKFSSSCKSWRVPLFMAFFLFVIHTANIIMEHSALESEDIALTNQMKEVLLTSFPDSSRVVKPYAQMEYKLKNLRKSKKRKGNFVSLLNQVSPIINEQTNSTTQSLRYKNHKIEVDLNVSDLKVLDDIKLSLLRDAELNAEIKTAASKGDYVFATLQIMERKE